MKNRTLSLAGILLLFTFLFPGSFAGAAEGTDAPLASTPADCCLPVLEKEAPSRQARVYLEPGGNSAPYPFPQEPRPTEKSGKSPKQSMDMNEQIWNEEKFQRRNRWTLEDTLYQVQYTLLHIVDWGQTRYIADSAEFYEMNPVLGANPNRGEVDLYFSVTLIGQTAIAFILPEKWRRKWQVFWIGLESLVTVNNSAAGVSMAF